MIARKHIKNAAVLFFSAFGFMWTIWQREIMAFPYLTEQWHSTFLEITWGIVYDFSLLLQAIGLICALASIWSWAEPHVKNEVILYFSILCFGGGISIHEFLLRPLTVSHWNAKFNFFWGIWIPWSVATFLLLALETLCLIAALASIWFWED
jgi:hypothetical protein